jgi:hypothetical protein
VDFLFGGCYGLFCWRKFMEFLGNGAINNDSINSTANNDALTMIENSMIVTL